MRLLAMYDALRNWRGSTSCADERIVDLVVACSRLAMLIHHQVKAKFHHERTTRKSWQPCTTTPGKSLRDTSYDVQPTLHVVSYDVQRWLHVVSLGSGN